MLAVVQGLALALSEDVGLDGAQPRNIRVDGFARDDHLATGCPISIGLTIGSAGLGSRPAPPDRVTDAFRRVAGSEKPRPGGVATAAVGASSVASAFSRFVHPQGAVRRYARQVAEAQLLFDP